MCQGHQNKATFSLCYSEASSTDFFFKILLLGCAFQSKWCSDAERYLELRQQYCEYLETWIPLLDAGNRLLQADSADDYFAVIVSVCFLL